MISLKPIAIPLGTAAGTMKNILKDSAKTGFRFFFSGFKIRIAYPHLGHVCGRANTKLSIWDLKANRIKYNIWNRRKRGDYFYNVGRGAFSYQVQDTRLARPEKSLRGLWNIFLKLNY